MGKKRSRKKYVSKGIHSNVGTKVALWDSMDRLLFKHEALAARKRVCFTIPNPDKSATNARFIKVCTNGK